MIYYNKNNKILRRMLTMSRGEDIAGEKKLNLKKFCSNNYNNSNYNVCSWNKKIIIYR